MSESRFESVETNVAASRSCGVLGVAGFVLALCGLAAFWVPFIGVGLWALGIGVSGVALLFSGARGFGVSGLITSAISFAFMYLFLVAPTLEAEKAAGAGRTSVAEVVKKTVTGGGNASVGSANSALKEIFSSFGYKEKGATAGTPDGEATRTMEEGAPEAAEEFFEEEDGDEPLSEESPDATRAPLAARTPELHARFPIARFAEISKHRTTWPRNVRLMRSRTISLWDAENKVIMGKIEIPSKSLVSVLDVKPDGSLLVRDRITEQLFTVLAADTDFAAVYAEKNDE